MDSKIEIRSSPFFIRVSFGSELVFRITAKPLTRIARMTRILQVKFVSFVQFVAQIHSGVWRLLSPPHTHPSSLPTHPKPIRSNTNAPKSCLHWVRCGCGASVLCGCHRGSHGRPNNHFSQPRRLRMKRFNHWKTIAIVAVFGLLVALQPVVTRACASYGGC